MKRLIAILILVGVLVAAIVYYVREANAPRHLPPPQGHMSATAAPVTVAVVERRTIRQALTLVGALRADRQAIVSAKVPARIVAVPVRAGARVRRGQTLVRLDIGDARAQIAGAEAAVRAAEAQVHKAEDGRGARAVEVDAQVAQARGGLDLARTKLRQAELGGRLSGSAARSDIERADAGLRQAEAGLRQAEAGLQQAEETRRRLQFLYSRGGVARADLEGAQAQADIARAARDQAAAALEQARAATRPATETAPLRAQVSDADVEAARTGIRQAEEGLRSALRARSEALRITERDIEAARALAAQSRAGLEQARAQVGSGAIASALDGVVTDLTARAGEFAQPGMPLMTVVAPGSVYLEAAVPARDAATLRPGMAARVTVDTLPGRTFTGTVSDVLPAAGTDGRSVPVRIRFDAGAARLTPGTMGQAVVELSGRHDMLSIPLDALRSAGDVSFVYVVAHGRAERRNVEVGAVEGEYTQVLSGLSPGEQVILSGPVALQPGQPVEVVGR